MKIVSIDIETTGLDPESCQVLQIGAVIDDTVKIPKLSDLPKFSCLVQHPIYTGQPVALLMNSKIFEILASLETEKNKEAREKIRLNNHIFAPGMVAKAFQVWLLANGIEANPNSKTGQVQINVVGKNFGTFDKKFLEKLPNWSEYIQVNQRIMDPSIIFVDWLEDDKVPNLDTCLQRAGIDAKVTHDAVQDAIDVIRILREGTGYYERKLYVG